MADLIERLRAFEGSDELGNGDFSLLTEAATEIERLRAEVERLRADRDSWEQQASDRVADWYAEHLRAERLAEALKEIRSRSAMNLAMRSDHPELTALLGDIYQIADAALAQEADRG